jgi:hypothetical protein
MITPPPELVASLRNSAPPRTREAGLTRELWLINQAYQDGADQELEACCKQVAEWQEHWECKDERLRAARRPKPPTLNSIALQMLGTIERDAHYLPEITDTIRKALEQLDD